MNALAIDAFTATSCFGLGKTALLQALQSNRSGLQPCAFDDVDLSTWTGQVAALDARNNEQGALPSALVKFECRNNRLAWLSLQQDGFDARVRQLIGHFGAARMGLFLGTSTAGMFETELAFRHVDPASGQFTTPLEYAGSASISSLLNFVRAAYGITGPGFVVSTACSSSAKVFAAAQRFLAAGLIDAALVGGVDSLCLTTLYGFHSLQLTSAMPCRPYDAARDGISVGEAAAFALLTRQPVDSDTGDSGLRLLGCGETSDAYHMSSPHPEGLGAQQAMRLALSSAGLAAGDIGYINLHGTATPSNDRAEGIAVAAVFGSQTPCSSTKGFTGHTLGAAGAVEAVISLLALQHGLLPGSVHTQTLDAALKLNYQFTTCAQPDLRAVLTNSFGFGGSNCSLIFGVA